MITRLGKGMLAVLLVLGLSLSGCSSLPLGWPGTQDFTHTPALLSRDITHSSESLSSDIERLGHLAAESDSISVVIRLEGASLSGVPQEYVVRGLKRHAAFTQNEALGSLAAMGATVVNNFWLTNSVLVDMPTDQLDGLASIPRVERVFENFAVTAPEPLQFEPLDSQPQTVGNVTWGLDKIGVPDVWALGYNGTGIRVAVLDTGVDMTHPDLAGRMYTINATDPTYPGGWIAFNGTGHALNTTPYDSGFHGTHTSGTVLGGNTPVIEGENIAIGVAPGARLMHAKVLEAGEGGTFAQVIAGMQWAVLPFDWEETVYGDPAHVINMSLGAEGFHHEFFIDPIESSRAAGIPVIAAIGNEGEGTSGSPGNIKEAFGIGATDEYDEVAAFSGGRVIDRPEYPEPYIKPDFSAPGVSVLSALSLWYEPPYRWAWVSGTSMAAPHVAGTVALMLQADPTLTVDAIYVILENTGVWYDQYDHARPCTRYGYGRIDAHYAILEVTLDSGIEGHVFDEDTTPIEGVRVSIDAIGESRYSDDTGYYRFHLEPGSYSMAASLLGYVGNSAEDVVVTTDAFTSQNFTLEQLTNGFIEGTVTDSETGLPIEGAAVTVPGTPFSAITLVDGEYFIEAPPGAYDVRASHRDYYEDVAQDIGVIGDETSIVDFALEPLPWRWLYPTDWRPSPETGIGLADPEPWYGAMKIDLSGDIEKSITHVAYYDYLADHPADAAQVHVAENVPGGDYGAPGPWLASTDVYTPTGAGWVELELTEVVRIQAPAVYWIVVELDDVGDGCFPFGVAGPSVEYAGLVNLEDPHDPDAWDTLMDFGLNYSWLLEVGVASILLPPTITTGATTDVTTSSATLNMDFTLGDYSPIEVSFAFKKSADADWSHTDWIEKTAAGSHGESLTGLSSGTAYDFRATLSFDSEEITGDTLQFTTATPPPARAGCFIATAAYGTDSAEEINILREFRDTVLLPNTLGARFVSFYYTTSPPIADFISRNEFLRTLVRVGFVDRIVDIVSWTHNIWS